MWICSRCQTSNEEGYARCLQCGASRTARRFGAGTPVAAPSVADAAPVARVPAPAPTPRQSEASSRPQRAEAQLDRRVVRCALGRLLVALGLVLALLLPAVLALLAVIQVEVVKPALLGVLLPTGTTAPAFLATALYVLCVVLAGLLVALPGLTAAGLGRLLIRLTPPERRR
mgnify:FL=1|jgi:hypothetical protein